MKQIPKTQVTSTTNAVSSWRTLYKIAGTSALLAVALIPIQIFVYIVWGIPETAMESFNLFQTNRLVGLLALELLYLLSNILSIPIFLGFYITLKRENESVMAVATVLGFISIVLIFAARPTFDMLYLSDLYAAATTEAQREILLAAGEAKLALIYGTAQKAHYILGSGALLLVSIVMLYNQVFSKATAYIGVIANLLAFGLYVPTIGLYISIFSVFPFLMLWLIFTGRKFLQLGFQGKDSPFTTDEVPVTRLRAGGEGV